MTGGQALLGLLLFPLSFLAIWLLVARITALFGWDRLARKYACPSDVPAAATKFGYQSGSTASGAAYRNCLHIWTDEGSFYLRPSRLFAMFHPLLKIDYRDIVAASPRQWRKLSGYAFQLPDERPDTHDVISLYGPAAAVVHDAYHSKQTQPLSERPDL